MFRFLQNIFIEYVSKFVCVEVKQQCERTLPVVCAERTLSSLHLISAFINGTRPASYGGLAVIITNAELALRQEYDELIRDFAASKCLLWLMKSVPFFCLQLIWKVDTFSDYFLWISVEKHLSVFVSAFLCLVGIYWKSLLIQFLSMKWISLKSSPPAFSLILLCLCCWACNQAVCQRSHHTLTQTHLQSWVSNSLSSPLCLTVLKMFCF